MKSLARMVVTLLALGGGPACDRAASGQIFGPVRTIAPAREVIGRMGIEMPEADARRGISFRPFAPARRLLAVALLPAFHGDDVRANRGIAYEYLDASGRRYALAEWPANGGGIGRFVPLNGAPPDCGDARIFSRGRTPSGIVWSTPHGFIVTLQADGSSDARTLQAEWRRLIRRGACR